MVYDSVYEANNYLRSPMITPTVTFEDDFTSSPNGWTLGSGQTIETTGGSGIPSTIGYLYADGNDVFSSKPLAIGSPTKFVMDFDYAPVDGAPRITFMILNSEIGGYGASSSGHKKILFSMHQNGVMVDIRYRISGQSEVEVNAIDSVIPAYDGTISYYRMIKTSGNVTVKRYASDANRTSDTSSTDISLNFTEAGYTGTADLAYLIVGGKGTTGGYSRNAKLYDFKFYSGVTDTTTPYPDVRKQHFWEWFSGATLNSRWNERNLYQSSTFAMSNSVDGGFSIVTNGVTSARSQIDFNNKIQYSATGSVFIGVYKKVSTTNITPRIGFTNDDANGASHKSCMRGDPTYTYMQLETSDGTATTIDSTVAPDTAFHTIKIENTSTSNIISIDGGLEVSKTTNRPTSALQPVLFVRGLASVGAEVRCNYMEAYNT